MKKIFAIALSLYFYASAFADTVSDIQRNIDAQYKDMQRHFEMENRIPFKIKEDPKPQPPQNVSSNASSSKFIKKIEIKNKDIPLIHASALNKIIKPFANKALTMKEVGDIQQKIQQYYFDKGYSSTRIYIDGNAMEDGVLTFVIIDGYIQELVFKRQSGRKIGKIGQSLLGFSFYPFAKGALLNMKDLDQGLEQVNRLATSNSTLEILSGASNGYSIVEIINHSKKRFLFSFNADNSGVKGTGIYKDSASLSADNLLMLNDNITFTYSGNIDGGSSNQQSANYFVSFSLPIGYFTFMFSSFNSGYATPAGAQIGSYTSDGSTKNNNISLESVIKRGQSHKYSLGAEMALKDTQNNIGGQRLETSSKKLSVAGVFLTASYSLQNGSLYGKFSYNKGLDCFDAAKNTGVKNSPMAQFYSLSLYCQFSKYFKIPLINIDASYNAALNAQGTSDILYSSEQTTLGGLSSVRGFKEGSVSGDNGGYIRNDLKCSLASIFGRGGFFGILRDASIGAFVDYGYARHSAYAQDYELAGTGANFSYRMKYFNASFTWSRNIYNVSDLQNEGDVLYFNLEAKYSF